MDNQNIEIQTLKDICSSLTKQLERCEKQNRFLREIIDQKERIYLQQNISLEQLQESYRADQRKIVDLETKTLEWQQISGVIAHTIKTDVFNALNALDSLEKDITFANSASQHIIMIRNLVELILLYLRRDRAKYSGEIPSLNLGDVICKRINDVKSAWDSLPVSQTAHKLLLKELNPSIEITGNPTIYINIELKSIFDLIFNDLLRNAFTNTDSNDPQVYIRIEQSEMVNVRISNNKLISDDDIDWFEKSIESASLRLPTFSKIGLRFIRKWGEYLGIKMFFSRDTEKNLTTFNMEIPRRIEFE